MIIELWGKWVKINKVLYKNIRNLAVSDQIEYQPNQAPRPQPLLDRPHNTCDISPLNSLHLQPFSAQELPESDGCFPFLVTLAAFLFPELLQFSFEHM